MEEGAEDRIDVEVVVTAAMQQDVARAFRRQSRKRLLLVALPALILVGVIGALDGNLTAAIFAIVVLVPIVLVVGRRVGARPAVRAYPLGQRALTRFGRADVDFEGPSFRASLPYADWGPPVAERGVMVFHRRSAPPATWIMPTELCPPAAVERINAALNEAVAAPAPDPARFPRTFTADEKTADRLSSAVFWSMRRSWVGILSSLLPVALAVLLLNGAPSLAWVPLVALLPWNGYLYLALRRTMRRQFPPGEPSALGVREDGFAVHRRGASQHLEFADFDRVWVSAHAVVLRQRAQKQCFNVLPRGLLTDPDVELVRSAIR